MKYCHCCNQEKPFDPDAKRSSKASGFMGLVCWDCHIRNVRAKKAKQEQGAAVPANYYAFLQLMNTRNQ